MRELNGDEGERILNATRDDYTPFIEFAAVTGLRAKEDRALEWAHVNWDAKQIARPGGGGTR